MRVTEDCEKFELPLTKLRKLWITKETIISDFLNYLVNYQGKLILKFSKISYKY